MPLDFVDTPVLVVTGVLDGTVGTTSVDFQISYLTLADNESIEQVWQASPTFNTGNTNGWTNEDLLEDSTALSEDFTAGDTVFYYFVRDFGTDDFAGDFHVTSLIFQYEDN